MTMQHVLINEPIVTLYGQPREDDLRQSPYVSNIQDEGIYGMPATVLEEVDESWVKIRLFYNYEGYVKKTQLWYLDEPAFERREKGKLCYVIKACCDVLAVPKVQGIRICSLVRGSMLLLIESLREPEGWVKVCLNDGMVGYMRTHDLILKPDGLNATRSEQHFRKQLIDMAQLYMGTAYRWGGKTPRGIDCSGLCSMAYLLCGVSIYRDAKIKADFPVKPISYADKKPGDLLYFPGHVAMYLGEDLYIHATAHVGSEGVVINSLNPKHPSFRKDLLEDLNQVGSLF